MHGIYDISSVICYQSSVIYGHVNTCVPRMNIIESCFGVFSKSEHMRAKLFSNFEGHYRRCKFVIGP